MKIERQNCVEVTLENVHTFLRAGEYLTISADGKCGISHIDGILKSTTTAWRTGEALGVKDLRCLLSERINGCK